MKCWVCFRQARGFSHADLRFKVGRPRRYPLDWVFCSMRCQACFHRMYVAGVRAREHDWQERGDCVMNPTALERAAMQQCLKPLGEAASAIGLDRPLASYTQQEAFLLIETVVSAYVEAMVQEHERSRYPSVRLQLDASPPG